MYLVNVFTAAYVLEISTAAVYKAIHTKRLKGIRAGGFYWLRLAEVATRLGKTQEELLEVIRSKKRLSVFDPNHFEAHK